jgi:S1-C subfamily serine protease
MLRSIGAIQGGLIDVRGKLVGINVARIGNANFGEFAVPADAIRALLARVWLGW